MTKLQFVPLVFVLTLTLGLTWTVNTFAQQQKKQERIVFLGDSITQAGNAPGGYVSIVRDTLAQMQPDGSIEVIGAGISGNKVPDLQKRLKRDVLDKKPTRVVIYIGINDVWHSIRDKGTSAEDFEAGLNDVISQIKAIGSDVILCTPSMIGEKTDGSNDLDAMLEQYSEISRKTAASNHVQLLDLRKAFVTHLKSANPDGKAKGILTSDGVHLNAAGNQFVARHMLAALGKSSDSDRVLRHIVLFKFKEGLEAAQVEEVVDAFAALPEKVETIVDFEKGVNISQENLSQGFTHGFVVTFADQAGLDAYLPHPAHKEFVALIQGKIDGVLVFDYWSK